MSEPTTIFSIYDDKDREIPRRADGGFTAP